MVARPLTGSGKKTLQIDPRQDMIGTDRIQMIHLQYQENYPLILMQKKYFLMIMTFPVEDDLNSMLFLTLAKETEICFDFCSDIRKSPKLLTKAFFDANIFTEVI